MHIHYLSTVGAVCNGRREVDERTTVASFLAGAIPDHDRANLSIHVNHACPTDDQVLNEGDVVSIIPGTDVCRCQDRSVASKNGENPWLRAFGHAADDPDFEAYLENIRRARAAEDNE